jgi:hypothetical protein
MTNFIDLEAIAQQGPMFWGACLAVAMGLAMIAAATVVQTRRLGRKFSSSSRQEIPVEKPTVSEIPEPVLQAVPKIKEQPASPIAAPSMVQKNEINHAADRLERLLGRLDRVAVRLDRIEGMENTQTVPTGTPSAGESDLKEEPQGVEYVFRAAGG